MPQKQVRYNRSNKVNPFEKYLKPEDHLHIQVCRYIKYQYPGATIYHGPNEGKRSPFERYLMKMLEVSPGFPDLLIFYKGRLIALELKFGKNKPTEYQFGFIEIFRSVGIPADWVNSFDDAKDFIDAYLK